MGKEMDIMSGLERELVRRELALYNGPVQDILSYDGAYIREFPENTELTTLDLCEETAQYTKAAAELLDIKINSKVLDDDSDSDGKKVAFNASTIVFKLERIPASVRKQVYKVVSGEFLIISRKQNIFLGLFFLCIKMFFGKDIRRTGIFNFFGPYKPISVSSIVSELRAEGFKDIRWEGYFILPVFFEQIYQMFLQYVASEGSSYLHRERRTDFISKTLDALLRLQGFKRFGWLGSIAVIRCQK